MAGETQGETGLAGKKTIETIKAVRLHGSPSNASCLIDLPKNRAVTGSGHEFEEEKSVLLCNCSSSEELICEIQRCRCRIVAVCKSSLSCSVAHGEACDLFKALEGSPTGNDLPRYLHGSEIPVDAQAAAFSACRVGQTGVLALLGFAAKRSTRQLE